MTSDHRTGNDAWRRDKTIFPEQEKRYNTGESDEQKRYNALASLASRRDTMYWRVWRAEKIQWPGESGKQKRYSILSSLGIEYSSESH